MDVAEANRMRWQFQRGHYEVWYVTLSHRQSRTGFWIRYTLEAPTEGHGEPYAQLWFARFDRDRPERTFGFNRRLSIHDLRQDPAPFRVRLGDAELTSAGAKGALAGDGHDVRWDIRWSPAAAPHLHLPNSIYKASFADTLVLAPNLDVACHGEIVVDGETYTLDGDPLGQSHVWGKKHAYSWAWSHCNGFDDAPGAALETLSVRLRRGSLVLPKLTLLSLVLDGGEPPIHFRELWQLPLARSDYGTGRYALHAAAADSKVEVELTCRPEDMVMAEYVDPDGEPAYCHNTEVADARVTVWKRSPFVGRWRQHRTLISRAAAHFEWAARAGDPTVRKRHVQIDS